MLANFLFVCSINFMNQSGVDFMLLIVFPHTRGHLYLLCHCYF